MILSNKSEAEVFSSIGIDLTEFEADFKAGKFDGIIKNITAKKPAKKADKIKKQVLLQKQEVIVPAVEIPQIVAFSHTELLLQCACGCISSFILNKKVKRVFKSGRVLYSPANEFVKETAELQLPIEKLTSSMDVMQCDNCATINEDFT